MKLCSSSQRIPANVKEALIFDINDDDLNEVVLALTDRVVRSYQWQQGAAEGQGGQLVPMNKWEFGLQVIIMLGPFTNDSQIWGSFVNDPLDS